MIQLPAPPVPELARAEGSTRDEMVRWLLAYYAGGGATWNYITGTRCNKQGYRGFHDLPQLVAGTAKEKQKQGRKANAEIVSLAAPVAFGRKTQVFDLPKRRFSFGRDLQSGYRVPFFFVEDHVVKLYFLQPRKGYNLTMAQMGMVATIHKKFLLDTEFYGERSDIEYVDLSADKETGERTLNVFSISSLELWSEARLADRLSLISESIDYIKTHELAKEKRRRPSSGTADMPLFD